MAGPETVADQHDPVVQAKKIGLTLNALVCHKKSEVEGTWAITKIENATYHLVLKVFWEHFPPGISFSDFLDRF